MTYQRKSGKHAAAGRARTTTQARAAKRQKGSLRAAAGKTAGPQGLVASPKKLLVLAAAVVAALAVVAVALSMCSPAARSTSNAFAGGGPYDWSHLAQDERGRLSYNDGAGTASLGGIDVSEHQGYIDWNAVAEDGVAFAFIRVGSRGATSGEISRDEYFSYNIDASAAAGIETGVYFFSQAVNEQEAVEEARFVIDALGGRSLAYPVVYDHEPVSGVDGRADGLSVEQMTANARAFCETLEAAGYATMIYGNSSDLMRYEADMLADRGVWYAQYGTMDPSRNSGFSFWQYTSSGHVAGIDTNVDLDLRFVSE